MSRKAKMHAHGTGRKFVDTHLNVEWMNGDVQLSSVVPTKSAVNIRLSPESARELAETLIKWADYVDNPFGPRP